MISFITFLMFGCLPIFIIFCKYYEIREIARKNNCSILEAIKTHGKLDRNISTNSDDEPFYTMSDDYDQRCSPAYRSLSSNIHHHSCSDD